jgi:hypothetical protein
MEPTFTINCDTFNPMRTLMGMGSRFTNDDEGEIEKKARLAKNEEITVRIAEERKDEVDLDTNKVLEAIFFNSEFPENWKLLSHFKMDRQDIKDEVVKVMKDENKINGIYGCPCCHIPFFEIENNNIIKWSKHEFSQLIVYHKKMSLGICCLNYDQSQYDLLQMV